MTTTKSRSEKPTRSPFPRLAPQSERDAVTARIVGDDLAKKFITMRAALTFRFPAHSTLEARRKVIAQFVRRAQAEIVEEEEREARMAAIREALRDAQAKGKIGKFQQTAVSIPEAAELLGITEGDIKSARGMGLLVGFLCGYEFRIGVSELERFKAERWPEFFRTGSRALAPIRTPSRGRRAVSRAA
jgi:hypothetical protein